MMFNSIIRLHLVKHSKPLVKGLKSVSRMNVAVNLHWIVVAISKLVIHSKTFKRSSLVMKLKEIQNTNSHVLRVDSMGCQWLDLELCNFSS